MTGAVFDLYASLARQRVAAAAASAAAASAAHQMAEQQRQAAERAAGEKTIDGTCEEVPLQPLIGQSTTPLPDGEHE